MNSDHIDRLVLRQKYAIDSIKDTFVSTDLKVLWNKRPIDDEFYKYFVQTSLKMLESKPLLKESSCK